MSGKTKFTEVSIIIPCYNEGNRLEETARKIFMDLKDVFYEIILVNDGSTDNTFEVMKKIYNNYMGFVRIISYGGNWGKGHAVHQGIDMSNHPIKVILDADYSVSARYIKDFDFETMPDQFIIKGQRQQIEMQSLYRVFLGKCWQILVYIMTGINMDTQCPMSILRFKKEDYKELEIDGFAFDVELLNLAKKNNYAIIPYPVKYYNKKESKVTFKKTIEMFWDLLRIK